MSWMEDLFIICECGHRKTQHRTTRAHTRAECYVCDCTKFKLVSTQVRTNDMGEMNK